MADVKYSVLRFPGDGSTINWELNFAGGYLSKDHIKAYTSVGDDPETTTPVSFTWVNDYTIKVSPAVPSGRTLTVYRDTPKDLPIVTFSDDVILTEDVLNKNAKQAVFIAAEMVDKFGPVTGWANMASGIQAQVLEEAYIREQADLVEAGYRLALDAALTETRGEQQGIYETTSDFEAQVDYEMNARVTADEAEATARLALTARVDTHDTNLSDLTDRLTEAEASVVSESIARANAISAEATARQAVSARVDTLETDNTSNKSRLTAAEAAITSEATTRANADAAEATARTALAARVTTAEGAIADHGSRITTAEAAITNEASARATADSAEVTNRNAAIASLHTTVSGEITAAVNSEASARATADAAEATARDAAIATMHSTITGEISAAVSSEASARATAVSAVADSVSTVNATVGSLSSTVSTHSSAISSINSDLGTIRAQWNVTLDVDGYVSGIYQTSTASSATLKFKIDQLYVTGIGTPYTPFIVDTVNNVVKMTNVEVDTIKAGSVTSASLAPKAVTNCVTTGLGSTYLPDTTTSPSAISASITTEAGSEVDILSTFFTTIVSGGGRWSVTLTRDGSNVKTWNYMQNGNFPSCWTFSWTDTGLTAGSHTYALKLIYVTGDSDVRFDTITLKLTERKK